jgi:RimJ/RimL family protein N-acetyltransferase
MAFGPIMQLKVGELQIELSPLTKNDMGEFVAPGMQQASITRYLAHHSAPVLEDELEWFEKTRNEKNSLTWGIFVIEAETRLLIGNTTLMDITHDYLIQSTSGSMIFRKEFWGKGIASAIHKARTWYAFEHLGHTRIKSAVMHGNIASRKALEKSGYTLVYVERNMMFVEGELHHQDNLECLNPAEEPWSRWWGKDQPTEDAIAAREKTRASMKWAEENVILL